MSEADAFRDHCAVVGVFDLGSASLPESAKLASLMLYALQHRGQESAGLVAGDGEKLQRKVGAGLVADAFSEADLEALKGAVAIGHCRYATAGDLDGVIRDAGPVFARCQAGPIAIAHNGNLVNADALKQMLEHAGSIFATTVDTEVILHLIAGSRGNMLQRLQKCLAEVRGAWSLTVMGDGKLYAARDPSGVRPLVIGVRDATPGSDGVAATGEAWVVASESCAFDLIGARVVREVEPGEIVVIDETGIASHPIANPDALKRAPCVFEHVYFARPDSLVFGRYVHESRRALGAQLAREAPVAADVVIPVPDSGVFAAMGYAEQSGAPFALGLVRNHYVGRTFIEPEQRIRHFGVKLKLNPVRSILAGKRVVVVDDSIVRGTTSKKIVDMIRQMGAAEVHLRIAAPATTHPCFYGVDTPEKEDLLAHRLQRQVGEVVFGQRTIDAIARFVGADSVGYLSRAGMHAAVWDRPAGEVAAALHQKTLPACDACFSGDYPIPITRHKARRAGNTTSLVDGGPV